MDDNTPAGRVSSTDSVKEEQLPAARSATVRELRPQQQSEVTALRSTPAQSEAAPAQNKPAAPSRPKRSRLRMVLFALLPVALVGAGYFYVTGGQIMSTDNAYIRAATVGVSTDVSGTVVAIEVRNNEQVKKGQILYRINPRSFQIALDSAKAQLGAVRSQVLTIHASYQLALVQVQQAKANLPYYQLNYNRQVDLASRGAASKAALDQAQHDLVSAQQGINVAQAQAAAALAQLDGDANQTVEQNAFYMQAQSMVDDAQRNFNDTIVHAPFDGVVTNVDSLQVGSYLKSSQPGFSLVSNQDLWVEATPKETELTYVRPGQAVDIEVDAYPGRVWKGDVESVNPASASSFSLLPAQNTTGNWVKVVQRIPMRIKIDDPQNGPPLRIGMSVTASIDTGHVNGLPGFLTGWFGKSPKSP